jgi:hypothetical protein
MNEPNSDFILRLRHGDSDTKSIRFRRGDVAEPIAVGKAGQWRVMGDGVEDVHAYLQFDGRALWAMAVHAHNPPRLDGMPLSETWTEVPAPSVLAIGTLRIVVDQCDDDERPRETEHGPPQGDEVQVVIDDAPDKPQERHASTRILGSDVIAAAIDYARAPNPPSPGDASSPRTFDPARTRILDMNRLWPEMQQVAAARPASPTTEASPRVSAATAGVDHTPRGLETPPAGVPKGLAESFRRASPRRRAIAFTMPITLVLLVIRWATDQRALSHAGMRRPAARETVAAEAAPDPATDVHPPIAPMAIPATRPAAASAEPPTRKGPVARTLEREAADAVARADYASARRLYEELAAAHPDRPVFRESARILAEKASPAR